MPVFVSLCPNSRRTAVFVLLNRTQLSLRS
ncbi:Uncharacterised protein [Vibrio cholerae]|nr:Uncharacterised protein [Vibrio cholerae]